jgi:drug/metabolite transporter (DMT)-like permease
MELGLIISLIFVILCPFAYAFVNLFDKYIVSYRIKKPLGISGLSFLPLLIFGLLFFLISDWQGISLSKIIYPILGGFLSGCQYYLYFFIMKKEDASSFSGMTYFYPVVVAVLSFFILNERLSYLSYIGIFLVIIGVVKVSSSSNSFLNNRITFVIMNIILLALYEFLAKLTTTNLEITNGLAITLLASSFTILQGFFFKRVRQDVVSEFNNLKWAFFSELITLFATATLFLALWHLSATIVSAIASIQPLIVLFYERIAERKLKKISQHKSLRSKIIPLISIVLGVVLLYLTELFK